MAIIDFHAHIDTSWDRVDELLRAQDEAGITRTVVVSGNMLDTLYIGDFLRGTASLREVSPNNDFILEASRKSNGRLIPFFTIDPADHQEHDLVQAVDAGFQGFKFNPIVHRIDFTDSALTPLFQKLDLWGAPLYLHVTLNPVANLEIVVALARSYRRIKFIVGHMGFATSDVAAIVASQTVPNIFLESSIGSVLAFQEAKSRSTSSKLLFGSEFPTHAPYIELMKLGRIFEREDMERIAHSNANSLLSWRAAIGL